MKERPILFSGPMVRAILDGRKSQTRRVVNVEKWKRGKWARDFVFCDDPNLYRAGDFNWVAGLSGQPKDAIDKGQHLSIPYRHKDDPVIPWDECGRERIHCPLGWPGMMGEPADRLRVRETWAAPHMWDGFKPSYIPQGERIHYAADGPLGGLMKRPSIFLPSWASRITLEIIAVRVERLQEIDGLDALCEGCPHHPGTGFSPKDAIDWYHTLWESINGPGSWDANAWVWVIEFKRITPTSEEGAK